MRQWQNKEPRDNFRGSYIRKKNRRYVDRTRGGTWKYLAATAALLGVFVYAAVSLVGYVRSSAAVQKTNEEVRQVYAATTEIPVTATPKAAAVTPPPAATQIPVQTGAPELLRAYQQTSGEMLSQMQRLREQNRDAVAWLKIPGVVDLPVVYRDNAYYLDHDFYGAKSKAGTLFLDAAHPLKADTQYLVIHGHNMNDGSMFGTLSHYRSRGYMAQHGKVYLTTLYRQEEYEVVGVLQLPTDARKTGYVAFAGTRKFDSVGHFEAFVKELQEHALYWKQGAALAPHDALLALSTCYEDERVVVMCRRVKPQ